MSLRPEAVLPPENEDDRAGIVCEPCVKDIVSSCCLGSPC